MKYNLTDKKLIEDGDIKDTIIEKHGYVPTFTLNQLEENLTYSEKLLKQARAQRDLETAKRTNIESHHPFVLDMEKFDRFAVHAWQEAAGMEKAYNDKIAELEAQLESDQAEIAEVKEQIPELFGVESPYPVEAPESSNEPVEEAPEAPSIEDEAK